MTAASKKQRCPWTGITDPEYTRYHDEEWGVPMTDGIRLFEKLSLEAFQSGLSWLTILRKRENFRAAFAGFDPRKIARFGPRDVDRLMDDAGIVRNRLKIDATISNAHAYLELTKDRTFSEFLWSFMDPPPVPHRLSSLKDAPPSTMQSKALSKALKKEGFRFVGPTTVYAFMQSTGMVNDHLVSCHRHAPCDRLQSQAAKSRRSRK